MKILHVIWLACVKSIKIRDLPSWVEIPPNVTKLEPKYYLMQYQEDLILPCMATGNPTPTVEWRKNGRKVNSDWSEVLTNGSLMLYNQNYYGPLIKLHRSLPTAAEQLWRREKELPGEYYCVAKNRLGTDFGNVINVRLPVKPNFGLRKKVKTKSLNMGQQLAIKCDAPIPPGSEVTRVWSYKNFTTIPINAMKRVTAMQNGEILFFSNIISKDNSLNIFCQAYEKVTRTQFHGKSYFFTVRNADKTPTKRSPKIYDNNTTKSAMVSAVMGRSQLLECVAGGVPTPEIRWEVTKNGVKSDGLGENVRLIGRNTSLEIIIVSDDDAGRYRCVADNGQGVDMKDFVVDINSQPSFRIRPNEVVIEPDKLSKTSLKCQASGRPTPTIKWFKNNQELTSYVNKDSIEVDSISPENTASYQCKISNKYAQITSSAQLLVLGKPPRSFADEYVSTFTDELYRIENKPAELKCGLFGHPTPDFEWFDQGPVKKTKGVRPDYVDDDSKINKCSGQQVCSIENVTSDRVYKCKATNTYGEGSVTIKLIKLTQTAVNFKQSPVKARNATKVTLEPTIEVDSYFTNYSVTWSKLDKTKGNKQLGSSERLVLDRPIIYEDDGKYEVRVKTDQDEVSSIVKLILQDVPEPPLELTLQNVDNGVIVKFEAGFDNYSPIISYRVQFAVIDPNDKTKMYDWQEKGDPLKHDKNNQLQQILIQSSQLVPWTNYTVHVQALNDMGYSGASARETKYATIRTKPAAPTQYVEKITATGVAGPGILRLKWSAVARINYNGPGFKHIVNYCPVDDTATSTACFSQCTETKTQVELGEAVAQYDIEGQVPYTKYAYKLVTVNDFGTGPETQCQYAFSGEEKPSEGPTNLRDVEITSNSTLFAWDAVPVAALRGKLVGYRIQYKVSQDGFRNAVTQETDQIEEGELLNLKPATQYEIKVAAVNGAGAGEYSRKLLITTKADYPDSPRNLEIKTIRPDSFNMIWEEPLNTNGEITGYMYQVVGNDDKEVVGASIQGGRRSRTDIPNLRPDTSYKIKLYAVNAKGKSKVPIIVTGRTLTYGKARPETPSKLNNVNLINGDVNVTWSFTSNDFPPENFTLQYKYTDFDNEFETIIIDNIATPFKIIKNLKPGANITVQLFATNMYGDSKNTSFEFETDVGAVLEGNIWFIAVLIGVGITFILIIIFCFVQHSKSGKYPVQNKTMDMMVEDHETTPEDKTLLPPASPSPCKTPNMTVYAPGDLRKASSEASDSIVGFGEGGHVTRHYTDNGSFIGQYAPGADSSQRNR